MTDRLAWLGRLWPRSLAAQLVLLALGALIAAQAASFVIFSSEREEAIRTAARAGLIGRFGVVRRMIERTDPALRMTFLEAANGARVRFELTDAPLLPVDAADVYRFEPRRRSEKPSASRPDPSASRRPRGPRDAYWRIGEPELVETGRFHSRGPIEARLFEISAPLRDGRWLNMRAHAPPPRIAWGGPQLLTLLAAAVLVAGVLVWSLRRAARPLSALADASERFGRGEAVDPLPETGPAEIRRAAAAFNEMQARLSRFVADRVQMLGAIGHDLRTPITAMRLRAELVEDDETRDALLANLDEMAALAESALAYARQSADAEETRPVDIGALVESVVEDARDLGQNAALEDEDAAPRYVYRCRPAALRRAFRNLVENAVRYGSAADIRLDISSGAPILRVSDRGPGMSDSDLEEAFKPFVRMEASRSQETGGVGLGLSIVRSIARAHGGDAVLKRREGGGLVAEIRLPSQSET